MFDEGSLDLGRRQPVPADVDDVVHPPANPVVSIVVTAGPIAGELDRRQYPQERSSALQPGWDRT